MRLSALACAGRVARRHKTEDCQWMIAAWLRPSDVPSSFLILSYTHPKAPENPTPWCATSLTLFKDEFQLAISPSLSSQQPPRLSPNLNLLHFRGKLCPVWPRSRCNQREPAHSSSSRIYTHTAPIHCASPRPTTLPTELILPVTPILGIPPPGEQATETALPPRQRSSH
jgi:hypothetical protein